MGIEQQPSLALLLRNARGNRSKYLVAKETGVAHGNLFGIEQGTRFPNTHTLLRLCTFYGIDFDTAVLAAAHDKLKQPGEVQ